MTTIERLQRNYGINVRNAVKIVTLAVLELLTVTNIDSVHAKYYKSH